MPTDLDDGGNSSQKKAHASQRGPEELANRLGGFHALTGSDTTSYIAGHSKKSAFKTFCTHHDLLVGLGQDELTEVKMKAAEKCVCKLYRVADSVETTDQARCVLFAKGGTPDTLPPTSNALGFHIKRAHYQAMVWKLAHLAMPELPEPHTLGWMDDGSTLKPVLTSLCPIPAGCMEIISCQCKTGCRSCQCKCRKSKLYCTAACGCSMNAAVACVNRSSE